MIFRKHLKIYFLELFKICLKQKWTITLDMIVMKDLVSLIIVMEQSLKLFVVNMENSKWMYLRIAIVPLSLRGFQNARRTSKFCRHSSPVSKKIHNGWDSQQM